MKKLYKIIFIIKLLVIGCVQYTYSQQVSMFTQALRSQELLNPSFNGNKKHVSALLTYRNQWVGVESSPRIMAANIRYPIVFKEDRSVHSLGVSANVISQSLGLRDIIDAGINLDTYIRLGKSTYLAAGINLGFEFYQYDINRIKHQDDVLILNELELEKTMPGLGIGFTIYHQNYIIGLSTFSIVEHRDDGKNALLPGMDAFLNSRYDIHENWELSPAVLIKIYSGYSNLVDLSLKTIYKKDWELVLGFRYGGMLGNSESMFAGISMKIQKYLRIGYSYDFATRGISTFGGGSHEVSMSFDLVKEEK